MYVLYALLFLEIHITLVKYESKKQEGKVFILTYN